MKGIQQKISENERKIRDCEGCFEEIKLKGNFESKIKKVEDNTAEHVEIAITIPPGISPDKTIDALYRFTDCEIPISPLSCIIEDNTPLYNDIKSGSIKNPHQKNPSSR